MKEKLPTLIAVLSCILTVVCLIQIADLKNELQILRSDVGSNFSTIHSDVVGISNTVRTSLDEQTNLISNTAFSYAGEPDMDALTVPFTYSVTAKTYDPQNTKATLYVENKAYPMTLKNGAYTATFDLPVFSSTIIDSVKFETDGVISTQNIDSYHVPKQDLFPELVASYSGKSSITHNNGFGRKTYSGNVSIEAKMTDDASFASVNLVGVLDGKIIREEHISYDAQMQELIMYDMKGQSVDIPFGSTYELYVEATDRHGLRYRSYIDREKLDASGTPDKTMEFMYHSCQIYSADGEFLYGPRLQKID